MTEHIDQIGELIGLKDFLTFKYGSRVYGTEASNSDYDYLVVIPEGQGWQTGHEIRQNDLNITLYTHRDWQEQLNLHKIHTLETYFSDEVCRNNFRFKLDKVILRHELSEKSKHSFVKAKKKIEVEKDFFVGWKSLFHSLRILMFGIQIARDGKISNFGEANGLWTEIRDAQQYNWAYFKERYQPIHNQLASEFRLLAPKE